MAIRGEFLEKISGAAPVGWERGDVLLTLEHPDERISIEAWRKGAFAIHETQWPHGARLTHAPSGLSVYYARDVAEAAEFADRIEPFTDWGAIKEKMPHGSDLYPKVREVRLEFNARSRAA